MKDVSDQVEHGNNMQRRGRGDEQNEGCCKLQEAEQRVNGAWTRTGKSSSPVHYCLCFSVSEMPSHMLPSLRDVNWKECVLGKRMRKWAFWFVIAFLSILTVKDVFDLVVEYGENPTKSDMSMVFNESMTMPNLTFCMAKNVVLSHWHVNASQSDTEWDMLVEQALTTLNDHHAFLSLEWDWRLVLEAYEVVATLDSLERETSVPGFINAVQHFSLPHFATKRSMIQKWIQAIQQRHVSFEQFTHKVGTEALRPSIRRFDRTSYDERNITTRLRISWLSQMQVCFQPWFDQDNWFDIDDQGDFFSMLLLHEASAVTEDGVACMSVDVHGRVSSLSRFMQGKGRTKDGFTNELCAGRRHEVKVEVRAKYEMLENDRQGTACRESKHGDADEFQCRSECRMHLIQTLCGCTALTLSHLASDTELKQFPWCNYTTCNISTAPNVSDESCSRKCYRDCIQVRFHIEHETLGRMVRPELTLVQLKWGSFEYLALKQDWVWSVASFIAALGGSIGMWLGLSILSLIQGGTYLYLYLTREVIKRRVVPSTEANKNKNSSDRKFSVNPLASPFGARPTRELASQRQDSAV